MSKSSSMYWLAAAALVAVAAVTSTPTVREWVGSGVSRDSVPTLTGPDPKAWVEQIEYPEGELLSAVREVIFEEPTEISDQFLVHVISRPPGPGRLQPHNHDEEEVIVPIEGKFEILRTDSRGQLTERITPGKFVHHAADQPHAISSLSEDRSQFLVIKWRARKPKPFEAEVGSSTFNFQKLHRHHLKGEQRNFKADTIFEGATRHLKKLHSHASTLQVGAGYDPQVDDMDIAMVLFQGEVETLGEKAVAPAMFFYPAGHPHGLRNVGDVPAQYVVFEFHGR